MELGELFEGDIVLTPSQKKAIRDSELIRNGLISITSRWPNSTVVYHVVKEDFGNYLFNFKQSFTLYHHIAE